MSRGKCTGGEIFSRTETRSSARTRSGPRAAPADLPETARSGRTGTRPAPGPDRQHPPGEHQRRQRGPGDRPRLHQRQQETGSSTGRRSSKERRQQETPKALRTETGSAGNPSGERPPAQGPRPRSAAPQQVRTVSRSGPAPRTGSASAACIIGARNPAEISRTPGRPPAFRTPPRPRPAYRTRPRT